jgi:hypothetical protein
MTLFRLAQPIKKSNLVAEEKGIENGIVEPCHPWMPIFFGIGLLALGRESQARTVRWIALAGAMALPGHLPLYDGFQLELAAMQFPLKKSSWVPVRHELPPGGRHLLWFVLRRLSSTSW